MMRCRQFFILVAVAAGTRTSLSNVPESAFESGPVAGGQRGAG